MSTKIYREDAAPYFNDFETNGKKYHKLLFVPGRAIQARELIQMQDVFYEQQRMHSTKTISPGVAVSGCIPSIKKRISISISNVDQVTGVELEPQYVKTPDDLLTTDVAGCKFIVTEVLTFERNKKWFPDENRLILIGEYLSEEKLSVGSKVTLLNGEFLVTEITEATYLFVDKGVVYAEKYFIEQDQFLSFLLHPTQPVINHIVGFFVDKKEVTYLEDRTLLDRSIGYNSSNSPGANRLRIDLVYYDYDPSKEDAKEGFHKLIEIKEEVFSVINTSRPDFSEVYRRIAENSYETNGHFYVKPYKFELKEHLKRGESDGCGVYTTEEGGTEDKFVLNISSGEAYVYGWNVEHTKNTQLVVDKLLQADSEGNRTDIASKDDISVKTTFGQYFICDQVSGSFWNSGEVVRLYDVPQNSWQNQTFGNTGIGGVQIGVAKLVSVAYYSGYQGTAQCQYAYHLADIQYLNGKSQMDVQGLRVGDTEISVANVLMVTVPKTTNTRLVDGDIRNNYFRLPNTAIKTISDFDFFATSSMAVFRGDQYFELNLVNSKHTFHYGVGRLSKTEINENLKFVASNGRLHDIEYAELLSETHLRFKIDESIVYSGRLVFTHKVNGGVARKKIHKTGQILKIDMNLVTKSLVRYDVPTQGDGQFQYGEGDTFDNDNQRNDYNFGVVWDGTRLKLCVTDVTNVTAVYVADEYDMTGTNYIDQFIWNSGQQSDIYNYAYLMKTPLSTVSLTGKKIVVVFDHFVDDTIYEHDGFYSVDSYSGIPLCNIPYYGGDHLRDVIDFRMKMVSCDVTDDIETTHEMVSLPNRLILRPTYLSSLAMMNINFEHYLPRWDLVQLSKDGIFSIKQGIPNLDPMVVETDVDNIPIVELRIPPYMSLAPCNSSCNKDDSYPIKLKVYEYKRYTMRNIRGLEDRITALEYYVALSLLETQTEAMNITDKNGLDRFKNGFLVDDFSTLTVCNFGNTSVSCSIDRLNRYLRASYDINQLPFSYDPNHTVNVKITH